MRWLLALTVCAALAAGGCDQIGLGPPQAASVPTPTTAPQTLDLRRHAGKTFAEFAATPDGMRYSMTALGLTDAEQARFARSMVTQRPAPLAQGGGVEALVFAGCAAEGCLEGLSVVAIDVETGDAFVGVSDLRGSEKAVPNDRLEALLRLTSPSQTWDDPVQIASNFAQSQP